MWTRMWVGAAVVWAGAAALPVEAHMRDYLVSQQYYTAKRGEFEVELFNDIIFPETKDDGTYNSKHQVELEYGLTDHLQLAYYEVYTWDRAKDWERDRFKIELKVRLAEAGQWPVDVALYTEYENPDGHRDRRGDVLENKVILSKDVGAWNLIGNVIFKEDLNRHSNWLFGYTAGVSYAVRPAIRLGLEVKASLGESGEFLRNLDARELLLVPGIYANLSRHVRVLAGLGFGLTRGSDDLQLKSIVEIEF